MFYMHVCEEIQKTKIGKTMTLLLTYLILSGFMFGLVAALYLVLKTIKLI